MKRLCILLLPCFFCLGCAAEGEKSQWDEFWKDLRGDNMKMQSDRELGHRPPQSNAVD
jgi:hypothetical protein